MADIIERPPAEERLTRIEFEDRPEGPIAAAVIAGGVGAAALGVGPLSGKTILAVVVWLVAWAVLHAALRGRPYETRRALVVSLVLIALGVLGPFPTIFQLFGE